MTIDDALAVLKCDDAALFTHAGPAVLRLKLLEYSYMLEGRRLSDEIREAALTAVAELRRLIAVRPCVSQVDFAAREMVFGSSVNTRPHQCRAHASEITRNRCKYA